MPYATERLDDHMQEDAAARIARRIDRDLRLRTRRRRAALIAAVTALGVLLLVVGLSVAMARGRDTRSADAATRQVSAISSTTASESPTTAAEAPTSSVPTVQPSEAPAPKPAVQKAPPKPAVAPTKKKAVPPAQSDILVQKCSGSGCHSTSEVSGGGLDVQSAQGVVQAMADAGYVNLSSADHAAVIAALTRK